MCVVSRECEGVGSSAGAAVFGQISSMLREGLSDASVCVLHYFSVAVPVHARHCLLQDAVPNWNLRSCNFSVSSDASDDNFTDAA
jgi:hypothetical protein